MTTTIMMDIESPATKRIALVAHDNMKDEMLEWAKDHETELSRHTLVGTGTTGRLITEHTGLTVERLRSGPLGGDQQLGARIAEGLIDILMFLGPTRTTATRPRHQSAFTYCCCVEHTRGLQPSKCRLHYLFPTHFAGVPATSAGIPLMLTATVAQVGRIDSGLDRFASPKKRS